MRTRHPAKVWEEEAVSAHADRGALPALVHLAPGTPQYPAALRRALGDHSTATVAALGNLDILQRRVLAVFCSIRCPGDLILAAYDLALALRDAGVFVASGFHSPVEQECLRILQRGSQPLVICPARPLEGLHLPPDWRSALAQGRLLLLSPFTPASYQHRPTADLAAERNTFAAALADAVLVAHAAPGGKTERLCRDVLARGTPLLTLDSPDNAHLVALGARPVHPAALREWWGE